MIREIWDFIRPLVWPRDVEEAAPPWRLVIDNFRTSTQECYAKIEAELQARELPGVSIKRLELLEAGPLSDQREYLTVSRERSTYEFCAAPFGTAYFFSLRTLQVPPRINRLVLFILFLLVGYAFFWSIGFYGLIWGPVVVFSGVYALLKTLGNCGKLGWNAVDSWLLRSRLVGGFYETYLRPETHFREDLRIVFLRLVETLIKETGQVVTVSHGVRIPHDVLRPPKNVLLSGGRAYSAALGDETTSQPPENELLSTDKGEQATAL